MENKDPQNRHRQWLVECSLTVSRDRDRMLMALSGGAMGVSIAFVNGVIPRGGPVQVWILAVAWFAFVGSLVFCLWSQYSSDKAIRSEINDCDRVAAGASPMLRTDNVASSSTEALNSLAALTCVFGIIALLVFAFINLSRIGQ